MAAKTADAAPRKRVDWGRRVLTSLVGIPMALKLLSSDVGMLVLATTLCVLSLVEFTATICPQIVPGPKTSVEKLVHRVVLLSSGVLVCVAAWTGEKTIHDATAMFATLAIFAFHLTTTIKLDQTALMRLLLDLLALLYIVSGFSHAILLRYSSATYGLGMQILGLSCAWVCDSGALVAGSFMGHAKLAPVVSPGKTLVGAFAGVFSSVVTVLTLFALSRFSEALGSLTPALTRWTHELLPPPTVVPLWLQVALGLVIGVLCILGDLVESYVKRVAGVKDSGTFFPGHGGCLDRMDSFLFVAPCLYFCSRLVLG